MTIDYSEQDKIFLSALAEQLGISQSDVMKLATRCLARQEGINVGRVVFPHD